MIDPNDMAYCRDLIRTGSLSFHAASKLLPAAVRDPALALYAFCRVADDEVDEGAHKARAVLTLQARLDGAYSGRPRNAPEDRAFAAIVEAFDMPRALPDALLEGLAWDAEGRRYDDLSGVIQYSARVASAVGAMMCVLMRVRDPDALARACDLGVAMQLTNIARDVGEDAREGRLYLPLDWLAAAGKTPEEFLRNPQPDAATRTMVRKLLAEARRLYLRSEAGIAALPPAARSGIFAARYVYAGIGTQLRRQGHDSITRRAHTNAWQKAGWMAQAGARAAATLVTPRSPIIYAPALPEVQFLVEAAADRVERGRTAQLLDALARLDARDQATEFAAE